uniref:Uncharacterized protein n=1 Tax=Calcidiscus leptoporus TaxID=127549 RepID=A0A7S0JE06_9EUKA
MFGRHSACAAIGISGSIALRELDGPVAVLTLSGRFWHRRATVLRNAKAWLRRRWPELSDAQVADPDDVLDVIFDDETGEVLEDRRAPDHDGNRGTMEYQGVDPDSRGPFAQAAGGFRAGGSMFS